MHKFTEIVVYILALIGLACIVKHIRIMYCKEGCCLCDWYKAKREGEEEKRTGSRYGSNPIKY